MIRRPVGTTDPRPVPPRVATGGRGGWDGVAAARGVPAPPGRATRRPVAPFVGMARLRTNRRAVAAGVVLLLVAVALAIGLAEGGTGTTAPDDVPSLAQAREDVAGAPAPLARLYAAPGSDPSAPGPDTVVVDPDAPDGVPLLDLDRDAFADLLRGLRGRPVLVNVWYPKCAPCVREFPILRTAAARYGTRMAFLGVATDGSRQEIAAFLRGQPTVYPHVRDPTARIARAELQAGNTYPSTVLIDEAGEIVGVRGSEYTSLAQLEGDLRAKLGVGPAAAPTTTTTAAPTR